MKRHYENMQVLIISSNLIRIYDRGNIELINVIMFHELVSFRVVCES